MSTKFESSVITSGLSEEDGSWTPTLADSSLDGTGEGQAYTTQVGTYTRIANRVWIECTLEISDLGTLTTSQSAQIMGLPYTARTLTNYFASVYVGDGDSLAITTAGQTVTGNIASNTAYISLNVWDSTAGASFMTIAEVSAGGHLRVSGTYLI